MRKTNAILMLFALSLSACATKEIPVGAGFPTDRPAPSALTDKPVSTGPSLSARFEIIDQQFDDSLTKAAR